MMRPKAGVFSSCQKKNPSHARVVASFDSNVFFWVGFGFLFFEGGFLDCCITLVIDCVIYVHSGTAKKTPLPKSMDTSELPSLPCFCFWFFFSFFFPLVLCYSVSVLAESVCERER